MKTPHAAFATPTGTRLQQLLDEGDLTFFARNPGERQRIRFYFRGEEVEDNDHPGRYVVVTRQGDGTLMRQFLRDGVEA